MIVLASLAPILSLEMLSSFVDLNFQLGKFVFGDLFAICPYLPISSLFLLELQPELDPPSEKPDFSL